MISVLDNGVGMDRETLTKLRQDLQKVDTVKSHIGLLNTHRRLVLTYGEFAGIHVGSKKGYGTIMTFHLPLISPFSQDKRPQNEDQDFIDDNE